MDVFEININTVDAVRRFNSIVSSIENNVDLGHGRYIIDAKSIMGCFALDLSKPVRCNVYAGAETFADIREKLKEFIVE